MINILINGYSVIGSGIFLATKRHKASPEHDDVIKWKHFPRYWPFVRGIHRSPVNSLHKGQWCGAFMFSLICAWISGWANNREAGDLRRHRGHYVVIVMKRYWPSYMASYRVISSHTLLNRESFSTKMYHVNIWYITFSATGLWDTSCHVGIDIRLQPTSIRPHIIKFVYIVWLYNSHYLAHLSRSYTHTYVHIWY